MRGKIIIKCGYCHKEFKRFNSLITGKRSFCSRQCHNKSQLGQIPHNLNKGWNDSDIEFVKNNYCKFGCKKIGKILNKSKNSVYCRADKLGLKMDIASRKALREETIKRGIDNPRWGKKGNQEFSAQARENMSLSKLGDKNPMRRIEVVNRVKEFYRNNPEAKEKRRLIALNGSAKNQRENPSKPQKKFYELLKSKNINFIPEFIIKDKFIVDCFIPQFNCIVQVDGEYWHGHASFYPLTERQLSQIKRDKAQDKYLTTCGYKIKRIWANDIVNDKVEELLNAI